MLQRVIPSTVLLCAIHYKGIEEGPTTAFVLDAQTSLGHHIARHARERNGIAETEDDKLHARWALLMEQLGISYTDQYEKLVSDYLDAGLIDRSAIDEFIYGYRRDSDRAQAQKRVGDFFQWTLWNPDLSEAEIAERAQALVVDVRHIDCYTVSALYDHLLTLEGNQGTAEQLIVLWISWLHELATSPQANPAHFVLDNWAGRSVHQAIAAAFAEAHGHIKQQKTLLEVCEKLAQGEGWGSDDELVMQHATVADFKQTILNTRGHGLKIFMLKNLDLYANRETSQRHFGSAPANFYEACREIRAERTGTRWPAFIDSVFRSANLTVTSPVEPE